MRSHRRVVPALLLGILGVTALCLFPTLSARKEFTNWDDPGYVTGQPLIRSLAPENVRAMFSPDAEVMANYHPLTILSLALDYRRAGLDVRAYAATSLVLHLANTLLVFVLLYRLTRGSVLVGALSALWFGIHPMHVESVAWISGRKEVLYTLFYLSSCLAYLGYLDGGGVGRLALSFGLFALACLSKATAVPLPLVLLLLDVVRRRTPGAWMFVEKVPFLAVSLVVGVLAARIQARAPLDFGEFSPLEQVALAAYAFVMYCAKLLVPYRLSPFYPYPVAADGSHLGGLFWALPAVALVVVLAPLAVIYRRARVHFRATAFGVGLFTLSIAPVIQLVPVGSAIMADRYTYLSSVGVLFLLSSLVAGLMTRPRARVAVLALVLVYSTALGAATYRRTWVWTNSETLWSDAIAKFPFRIEESGGTVRVLERGAAIAYQYRGDYYRDHGQLDRATRDWELLVKAGIYHGAPYINLGNLHAERGEQQLRGRRPDDAAAEFARALELYTLALERGNDRFEAYLDRAITYSRMGRHAQALDDFERAVAMRPSELAVWADVATEALQLGRYDAAIAAASRALSGNAGDANALLVRGMAYLQAGRPGEAIGDLRRSVALAPGLGLAWYNLALAYDGAGDPRAALDAARRARGAGHPVADSYVDELARRVGAPAL